MVVLLHDSMIGRFSRLDSGHHVFYYDTLPRCLSFPQTCDPLQLPSLPISR